VEVCEGCVPGLADLDECLGVLGYMVLFFGACNC
jgi:hypothetical protein